MAKLIRTDFDRFHDYGCFIPNRIIYFGSEDDSTMSGWEDGVNYASAKKLITNLLFLDSRNSNVITLYFSSPGGDWFHGMAIYDVIKGLKSRVNFIGLNMVRSMGTIICQACDKRLLKPNSDFMIHDGHEGCEGTPKTVEAWARYSKNTRERMYKIYYDNMKMKDKKITLKKIEDMCSHDCIMSAVEAVKIGLADKVIR